MQIHYLQHVPFEGPAAIGDWAAARGHQLVATQLYAGDALPTPGDFDWLMVLGGPMSVNDESDYPWLAPETRLIAETIAAGKPVLGICLGAQLIAKALQAKVAPGVEKEIGWFPVQATQPKNTQSFDGFPPRFVPLHWHGDAAELPTNAVRLARTEACTNQAFQVGANVIALQFHVEATPASVAELLANAGAEIDGGHFQQTPDRIADSAANCAAIRPVLEAVLTFLEARA